MTGSLQQSFLGNILGVSAVAQNSAGYPIGQRTAFGEAVFKFAADGGVGRFACPLRSGRAMWLDQNQLLHWSRVRAVSARPPRTTARRHGLAIGSDANRGRHGNPEGGAEACARWSRQSRGKKKQKEER
jgi:hypothetical protein